MSTAWNSFVIRWTVATTLGLGAGITVVYMVIAALTRVGRVEGVVGIGVVFAMGALVALTIGALQSIVGNARFAAWKWALGTAIAGGFGILALGALMIVTSGTEIAILEFASQNSGNFGTPQVLSDVVFLRKGQAPTSEALSGIHTITAVEQFALGALWAVQGVVWGGILGLVQRRFVRRNGPMIAWPLWSALGLGVGLVIGMGTHGILRHLLGVDRGSMAAMGGGNFLYLPTLTVGVIIVGLVYGVTTGMAIRR